MTARKVPFWIGLVLFLLGGVFLAYVDAAWAKSFGTTAGLVGVGVMAWAWLGGRSSAG